VKYTSIIWFDSASPPFYFSCIPLALNFFSFTSGLVEECDLSDPLEVYDVSAIWM